MNFLEKCRKIGKNALSQHAAFACVRFLAGHKVGKGVTERRVALTKKRWKKLKKRGSEGKILENCGERRKNKEKGGEKMLKREQNWRKLEKREGSGGQRRKGENKKEGKVGKPREPKACHTIPQTSLEFSLPFPVHLCTKSDHVRTASDEQQKCWKNHEKCTPRPNDPKSSARQPLGSVISGTKHKGTTWDRQRSCKIGPTTAKKTPKMPQN